MNWRVWASLILILAVAGAGGWAYWNYDLRWRPKTIDKHQAEIAAILESSGWVSPGRGDRKLYMISFRTCPDCLRFKSEELPAMMAAGVEPRVIEVARRDFNGISKSTPAERATVAQLWITRDWSLAERWEDVPPEAWTAEGIPPADGDAGRMAVVEAGRVMVDKLTPLMKANGVKFAYPLLVWWDRDGRMRGCACERRETYRFLRKELGSAS